ncbi:MAG: hypothetical protein LBR53_03130 [Deltaproteobacteria bacterium]|jgi:hypothetical protein|nr:hypothetical protein [Deltaproteobacteria bacterium]
MKISTGGIETLIFSVRHEAENIKGDSGFWKNRYTDGSTKDGWKPFNFKFGKQVA